MTVPASKTCPRCSETKTSDMFSKHRNRYDGLQVVCKACELIYRRRTQRRSDLSRKYGMTEADWDALLASQGGGCAICERRDVRLDVDHDHACCPSREDDKYSLTCGECRRGILCIRCNTTLGKFREDRREIAAAGWHAAVAYLERYAYERADREQVAS